MDRRVFSQGTAAAAVSTGLAGCATPGEMHIDKLPNLSVKSV